MRHKKGVEVIELIGIFLGVILILVITFQVFKLIGALTGKEKQSEIAFNSLSLKISELLNDPSPISTAVVPYFLDQGHMLLGFGVAERGVALLTYTPCASNELHELAKPPQYCGRNRCLCLAKKDAGIKGYLSSDIFKSIVKCSQIPDHDIFFSHQDPLPPKGAGESFLMNARGGGILTPLFLGNYALYKNMQHLAFAGDCAGVLFSKHPLYIEKYELPTSQKLLYVAYGNHEKIPARVSQLTRVAVQDYIKFAEQKMMENKPREALAVIQKIERVPSLSVQDKTYINEQVCYYSFALKNYALTKQACQQTIVLNKQLSSEDRIKDPPYLNTVYYNLARSLLETGLIVQSVEQHKSIIQTERVQAEYLRRPPYTSQNTISFSELVNEFRSIAKHPHLEKLSPEELLHVARAYEESKSVLFAVSFDEEALVVYRLFLRLYPSHERVKQIEDRTHAKEQFQKYSSSQSPQEKTVLAEKLIQNPELASVASSEEKKDMYHFLAQTEKKNMKNVELSLQKRKEHGQNALEYNFFLLQYPDEKYFSVQKNIVEILLFLEGPIVASEKAKNILSEYEKDLKTIQQQGYEQTRYATSFRKKDEQQLIEILKKEIMRVNEMNVDFQKELNVLQQLNKDLSEDSQRKGAEDSYFKEDYLSATVQYKNFFAGHPLDDEKYFGSVLFADATCKAAVASYYVALEKGKEDYEQCLQYAQYCLEHPVTQKTNVEQILPFCQLGIKS